VLFPYFKINLPFLIALILQKPRIEALIKAPTTKATIVIAIATPIEPPWVGILNQFEPLS